MSTESNTEPTASRKGMRKGIKLPEGIIRWGPADYMIVACGMVPLIAKGKERIPAISTAQKLLPKERRRPEKDLVRNSSADLMKSSFALAQAMTQEAREALIADALTAQGRLAPQPAAEKAKPAYKPVLKRPTLEQMKEVRIAADGKKRRIHSVRWEDRELALVARRVAYYQRELQDKRVLSRLIKVAQEIELPPERRRGSQSIDACLQRLRPELVRGFSLAHTLLADTPFDRDRQAYPGEPEPQAPAAAFEFVADIKPEPIESAGVNIDAAHKPSEAPAPVAAPTPPPAARYPVTEPIRAFGEVFAQGMSDLIQGMTREMMSELELRIGAMSERLMQNAIDTMARGVTTMVHQALERELGGPVATAEPEYKLPEGAALPSSLQLDVVGLIGSQITEVKAQLNGFARGIRFIDADQLNAWVPRGLSIINTKFISHAVEGKCRKAGVKPIRVQGGAGAIVNAIRELAAQEGVTLPH